ncbi:MAG TPA: Gfo/Idh/MocA family oxidoreductase [Dermatophilaceae bacterium]
MKVGVVGAGLFGRKHAMALRGLENVELVGVVDIDASRAAAVAREAGTEAFDSLEELLRTGRPDLVTIATPEPHHRQPVLTALAAGCHVFVEKPLATDVDDAIEMVAAAKTSNRHLVVGHVLRFDESHVQLVQRVREGELGEVRYIYARRNLPASMLQRYNHTHPAWTTLPHDVDLLRWLLGRAPDRVHGHRTAAAGDALIVGVLDYGDALAVVETCWMLPESSASPDSLALQVVGTAGTASLVAPGSDLRIATAPGLDAPDTRYWPESHQQVRGALREELAYVVRCIHEGSVPDRLDPNDAIDAVRTVTRILASASEGKPT